MDDLSKKGNSRQKEKFTPGGEDSEYIVEKKAQNLPV